MVKLLLHHGALVNVTDGQGPTALMMAIRVWGRDGVRGCGWSGVGLSAGYGSLDTDMGWASSMQVCWEPAGAVPRDATLHVFFLFFSPQPHCFVIILDWSHHKAPRPRPRSFSSACGYSVCGMIYQVFLTSAPPTNLSARPTMFQLHGYG